MAAAHAQRRLDAPRYERHRPEATLLYQLVERHYPGALAERGRQLPAYVHEEFEAYLKCGRLEHGFIRVRLARLRNQTFFSLGELNAAIARLLEDLNTRLFKKLEGCRRSRFEALERAALQPLPRRAYEFGQWRVARVHPDYHIEVERAYYSVPYRLIRAQVDVRLTASVLEIFHQGRLVATHPRAATCGVFRTLDAHRPAAHLALVETTLARLLERAAAIGPASAALLREQARHRKHPEETIRSAQGILRLARDFSPTRLEAACEQALALRTYSYRAVRTLIENPPPSKVRAALDLGHDNLRGPEYFQ